MHGIIPAISNKEKLYADLPNHQAFDNPPATIPQHIVTASALPDIVVIHGNKITLIELTVPSNSPEALSNAWLRERNKEKYQLVLSELNRKGFKASLITLEIGALGHSLPQTLSDLKGGLPCLTKSKIRHLFDGAGKISITCSQLLFQARIELAWSNRALQT